MGLPWIARKLWLFQWEDHEKQRGTFGRAALTWGNDHWDVRESWQGLGPPHSLGDDLPVERMEWMVRLYQAMSRTTHLLMVSKVMGVTPVIIHIYRWFFPWTKPSTNGVPPWLWKPPICWWFFLSRNVPVLDPEHHRRLLNLAERPRTIKIETVLIWNSSTAKKCLVNRVNGVILARFWERCMEIPLRKANCPG